MNNPNLQAPYPQDSSQQRNTDVASAAVWDE
jgi:hypothetical protein